MKKTLLTIAIFFIAGAFAHPAHAQELKKLEFKHIECSQEDTSVAHDTLNGAEMVKVTCSPADLKAYPFLADLTKDGIVKGASYDFGIARVDDPFLKKSFLVVDKSNETVYTKWGHTGGYLINADGTFSPNWNIEGGIADYIAICPKNISYILIDGEKKKYSTWTYRGSEMAKIADAATPEASAVCE